MSDLIINGPGVTVHVTQNSSVPQSGLTEIMDRLTQIETAIRTEGDRMANNTAYLDAALSSLDTQLSNLGVRLQGQADQLREALENASDLSDLRDRVNAAADKIQADAVAVSGMAQPSAVVDETQPDVDATPVPTDPAEPIPAPADGGSVVEPSETGPADGGDIPTPSA